MSSGGESAAKFFCPHPDCDKSFTRLEHLARHKLNHWPKEIFRCQYVYPEDGIRCNRTFVRKDLLVRHEKRHSNNGVRLEKKMRREHGVEASNDQSMRRTKSEPASKKIDEHTVQGPQKVDHIVLDVGESKPKMLSAGGQNSSVNVSANNSSNHANNSANSNNLNNFFNWLFAGNNQEQPNSGPQSRSGGEKIGESSISASTSSPSDNSLYIPPESSQPYDSHQAIPQQQPMQQSQPIQNHPQSGNMNKPHGNTNNINTNLMDDLFSVDFLPNDPLQSLVQQMSYDDVSSNRVNDLTSIASGSVASTDSIPNRSPKFKDVGKENVKDNLLAQKSKVEELKSQLKRSENFHTSEEGFAKRAKHVRLSKPSFFNSDPSSKFKLTLETQGSLALLIADLKYILLSDLQTALKSYWLNFHPQYPILHKPSFDINKEPPILILSMIMTGASYLGSANRRTISDVIAGPLRWLIFSHEDFQPTSETYIIQALLLLECYEKTSTNRYLHERSYLHHGTTIQLLRRTPSLGGHPLRMKKEQSPTNDESMEEIYRNWIDFETLKRTALYAFYIDTTHAVVFGYTYLFIHCNQVQLSLPCSDEIWDSYDLSLEKLLQNGFGGKDISFLDSLKKLLNHVLNQLQRSDNVEKWEKLSTSRFGEKLLLSGLISIMFQLQQHSEVISLGGDNPLSVQNIHWQEIISFAIDYWHHDIMHGCQNSSNSVLSMIDDIDDEGIRLLRIDDVVSCKIPAYHMTQIILRVFQYDYYIYAGAPWRMNVKSGSEEYALVSERMIKFSEDPMQGGMAIVYAYMFLFEIFNCGDDLSYDVNHDYCITRPNTLALTTLLIWSYNHCLYGPETQIWDNSKDVDPLLNSKIKSQYVPIDNFQQHLKKMYRYLNVSKNQDVFSYHQQLKEKARLLPNIPNTNHLAGMMIFMRDLFHGCYWELGREFCELFDNCYERSIGRKKVICEHMYET